jgi:hypothetical protein
MCMVMKYRRKYRDTRNCKHRLKSLIDINKQATHIIHTDTIHKQKYNDKKSQGHSNCLTILHRYIDEWIQEFRTHKDTNTLTHTITQTHMDTLTHIDT